MSDRSDNRVLFVVNPKSGRGRAAQSAELYADALRRQGLPVEITELGATTGEAGADSAVGARALVVFGGDGTVHSASALAARIGAPIYQVPFGTENLFARAFGMNRSFERLRAALLAGRTTSIDTADCSGRSFLIMCSAGPDASIVHRLAARRNGSISHLSYLAPIVAESWAPALPPLTVTVDGRALVEGEAGLLVVANCAQYALRLDPARGADPSDGLLDVVFLPASTTLGVLSWGALLAAGVRLNGRSRRARGRRIDIESDGRPVPIQIDGEAPPADPRGVLGYSSAARLMSPVSIEVRAERLRVLLPASN